MRIQHNIMAMSAYRNYTNNVSAMKKNLEKLSSGYKINRAGDDAAGLAISEKMRAQITGLETAQKNAKDGISLVQTAEGALTEVHDMLNRMVELATQSANGTYDNETDRYQLQKEMDQLKSEIDRIADSSNFNGIKLLDGSMSTDANKITGDARIISEVYTSGNAAELSGTKTFLDGEVATPETKTKFDVDFTGLTANLGAGAAKFTEAETATDGVTATVDGAKAGDGDVKVKVETTTAAAAEVTVADVTISGANSSDQNGITVKIVKGTDNEATTATSAAWDADTKTITITAATDATAATIKTAINGIGDKSGDGDPDFTAWTTSGTANLSSTTLTGKTAGGSAAGDAKVTITSGDGTGDNVYTETIKAADWTGTKTVTNAEKGVSVAFDTAKVTAAAGLAEATLGEVATDDNVDFTFTIAGKEFTVNSDTAATGLADKGNAAAIAAVVKEALDTQATADGLTAGQALINGNKYTYTYAAGSNKISFELADTPTEKNIAANFDWDVKGLGTDTFDGNHTAGVIVTTPGSVYKDAPVANTVFKLEASDIKDGAKITIDGTTVTLAVGKNSSYKNNLAADGKGTVAATAGGSGYIDLTWMEEGSVDLNQAISAISKGFEAGTDNFIVGTNDTSNKDTHPGLTVHKRATSTETYDTKAKLAGVFSLEKEAGNGLTLQIGDTADTYNQLKVSISDCHSASLGLSGVDISTQEGATAAVDAIKAAINKVSDVRGTLGATQNRLDHTINNLSVMTENIQDAESTIRDVDVAEEMMAYTKNNILIQSAQAMLAQANQVPQGVLQLLG